MCVCVCVCVVQFSSKLVSMRSEKPIRAPSRLRISAKLPLKQFQYSSD